MRSEGGKGKQQGRSLPVPPTTPQQARAPALTGSGLFFLGKKKALYHSFLMGSGLITTAHYPCPPSLLNTWKTSWRPLGRMLRLHRCRPALCWLTWDTGLLSIHRTLHYRLKQVPQETALGNRLQPGDQNPRWQHNSFSLKKPATSWKTVTHLVLKGLYHPLFLGHMPKKPILCC